MKWSGTFFLFVALFVLILGIGSSASAEEETLTWEYWQENTVDTNVKAMKAPPNFAPSEGTWVPFDPREGADIPEGTRNAWLRVHIPVDMRGDESFFFTTIDQSVRVYLDGASVYRYGSSDPQLEKYGRKWHLVNLPAWAAGRELIVRVTAENPWVLTQLNRVHIDKDAELIKRLFIYDFPYVAGLTAIVIFMMVIGVYFVVDAARRGIYLRLMLLLTTFFVWMFSSSNIIFMWMDWPVFWWRTELISSYLLPITASILLVEAVSRQYRAWIMRLNNIFVMLLVVGIIAEMMGKFGLYMMQFPYVPGLAVWGGYVAYALWKSSKAGNKHATSLLIALLIIVPIGIIDALAFQYRLYEGQTFFTPFSIYTIGFYIIQLILDRAEAERQLMEHASTLEEEVVKVKKRMEIDPLTGIYNRNRFPSAMRDFMKIARDTGEPLSLVMFDIDHFKSINDTYGHDAGDEVLYGFSQKILSFLDRRHVLIRWGGEEFILLCLHYDGDQAKAFADQIREGVAEARLLPERQVTCSGGVGVWNGSSDDTTTLVKRADTALYESKENGRNRVTCEPDWQKHMPPRRPKGKASDKEQRGESARNNVVDLRRH
ncbi:diguanylate cyclase domain-containing protein [uncultured Selenomonas sp.]|uniref:GGDEF domain-containing protein n=1 Tax=uncultured Selenomonas sp. TaxID=159275 RepID=UPI0028EB370C|nr:diguanylate cyclase [uncultured Selenomonas sp.]